MKTLKAFLTSYIIARKSPCLLLHETCQRKLTEVQFGIAEFQCARKLSNYSTNTVFCFTDKKQTILDNGRTSGMSMAYQGEKHLTVVA